MWAGRQNSLSRSLAGGGGIRVCLDFFVAHPDHFGISFLSRKKKERKKKRENKKALAITPGLLIFKPYLLITICDSYHGHHIFYPAG
jgi:hypothetical protein